LKKIFIISIIAVLTMILSFSPHDANAATNIALKDKASCQAVPISGTWTAANATCRTSANITLNSGDSLTVGAGLSNIALTSTGTVTNSGTITNKGSITNEGTIINNNGGFINDTDNSFITNKGVITNDGTIDNQGNPSANTGGQISNYGTISNSGTITNSYFIDNLSDTKHSGPSVIETSNSVASAGIITNNSGGTITNNNGANISNDDSGTSITNNGLITNDGFIENFNSGSSITNNSGGTITNTGTIGNAGSISNSGTINNNGTITDECGGTSTGNPVTGNPVINGCDPTSTTITPNPSSVTFGSTIKFNVKVTSSSPTTPSGTVSWSDGGTGGHFSPTSCMLVSSSSSASTCTTVYTPSKSGHITITATYAGETTHGTSSGTSVLTVTLRHTANAVTPNPSSVVHGNPITYLATITDTSTGTKSAPTGTVSWKASVLGGHFSSVMCTLAPISSSQSTCSATYIAPSAAGPVTISAKYVGDSTHSTSSGTSALTVS
jgi:hypothetical protein